MIRREIEMKRSLLAISAMIACASLQISVPSNARADGKIEDTIARPAYSTDLINVAGEYSQVSGDAKCYPTLSLTYTPEANRLEIDSNMALEETLSANSGTGWDSWFPDMMSGDGLHERGRTFVNKDGYFEEIRETIFTDSFIGVFRVKPTEYKRIALKRTDATVHYYYEERAGSDVVYSLNCVYRAN